MKRKLATLGLIGMLSGSPKAQVVTPKTEEIKKDLIEAVTTEQITLEDGQTISFEEAQKLQEQQKFIDKILNNEKTQELMDKYGQEEVEEMISEILTNKDILKVIEKSLDDEKVQKALEEGNEQEVSQRIEKILKKSYSEKLLVGPTKVAANILLVILSIVGWKKGLESLSGCKIVVGKKRK